MAAGVVGVSSVLAGWSDVDAGEPAKPFPAKKEPKASKVLDAMEGFRKEIPKDTRTTFKGTGMSVKEMEPYTLPHLEQVAGGLGVSTKIECLMLLTYLKDGDHKLRYIAAKAI
ncbi:MAG: hypothetical protein SF066_02960, partial [Thermoanaerobaculia bacterium]|nr:hypothetical protein [Thermoanaerobaculia bacterium]